MGFFQRAGAENKRDDGKNGGGRWGGGENGVGRDIFEFPLVRISGRTISFLEASVFFSFLVN